MNETNRTNNKTLIQNTVPSRLRVGSYNIRHGADVDMDMSVLAADLSSLALDLVGLQEVDVRTSRVCGLDTLALLAEAAGYSYSAFARSMDFRGGEYGTAILSRYPIIDFRVLPLPTEPPLEPRAVGVATVLIGERRVRFCNTHLSVETEAAREEQFTYLKELLEENDSFLLTGDFNTTEPGGFSRIAGERFVNRGQYPTYAPTGIAIDNIVYGGAWELLDAGMKPSEGHSDHNLLWAEFRAMEGQ